MALAGQQPEWCYPSKSMRGLHVPPLICRVERTVTEMPFGSRPGRSDGSSQEETPKSSEGICPPLAAPAMTRAGISKPSSFNTAPRPKKIAGHEQIPVREHQAPQARHRAGLLAVSMIGHTQEPKSYETIVKL
jgi:hypothetical protein